MRGLPPVDLAIIEQLRTWVQQFVHMPLWDQFHARGFWYYAVKHADEGEPVELRALLLDADVEMTDEGRALLSDYVWRYEIKGRFNRAWDMKSRQRLARAEWKKRRGRPATPIYERSAVDAKIDRALAELRAWRRVFGRARVPVEHMTKLWGISASTLQNALEGRRGSARRKAARRKGKLPRRKAKATALRVKSPKPNAPACRPGQRLASSTPTTTTNYDY